DAYALSYTTKDVVGVWLGNKSNAQIEHTGGGLPCNFSLKINEYLYENYKSKNETIADFSRPNSIVEIALDKTEYAKNQQLILCDDLSPTSERFTELFQEKNAPTKKSTKYTRPVIEQPTITYRNGVVQIDIKERTLYTFLIERECENKKTLLFQGTLSSPFIDKTVEQGKVYIYTITPIFNSISGTPFQTPKINTETAEPPPNFKNEDWWNE
ncbi:MAG: hypothetical protein IJV80_01695, partial [Clostridia bacterium]|nr:hypothetical protein [Clostridia bacterium]